MATPPDFTAGAVLTAAQMNKIGMWLIDRQVVGTAVSSVDFTSCFSGDFENYRVHYIGNSASASAAIILQLGTGSATTANYNSYLRTAYATWGSLGTGQDAITDGLHLCFAGTGMAGTLDIMAPNIAVPTYAYGGFGNSTNGGYIAGRQTDSTAFTSAHIKARSGTITGGSIAIYGYNSQT